MTQGDQLIISQSLMVGAGGVQINSCIDRPSNQRCNNLPVVLSHGCSRLQLVGVRTICLSILRMVHCLLNVTGCTYGLERYECLAAAYLIDSGVTPDTSTTPIVMSPHCMHHYDARSNHIPHCLRSGPYAGPGTRCEQ